MSDRLQLLIAAYASFIIVTLVGWLVLGWWQQRKIDREEREWRRQWHEDYRKQQAERR